MAYLFPPWTDAMCRVNFSFREYFLSQMGHWNDFFYCGEREKLENIRIDERGKFIWKKLGDDPFFLHPNFQGGLGKLGSTPSKST